jgi:hypothetical protein
VAGNLACRRPFQAAFSKHDEFLELRRFNALGHEAGEIRFMQVELCSTGQAEACPTYTAAQMAKAQGIREEACLNESRMVTA